MKNAGESEAASEETGEPAIGDDGPTRGADAIQSVALGSLEEDKAGNVTVIDLVGKSSIADAMIVASGRSRRHVAAVAESISPNG